MAAALQTHVETCLTKTNNYDSKIMPVILAIDGMSGVKTRHFYNNICDMVDARYLEIGTYNGSTICAAMCGNNMTCTAIDYFDGDVKTNAETNVAGCCGDCTPTIINQDCWTVDVNTIGPFNIYAFDGANTYDDYYKALDEYLPCLDAHFIYIVDDWNLHHVRNATNKAIADNNLTVVYEHFEITSYNGNHARPNGINSDWHNGIGIFVLSKP